MERTYIRLFLLANLFLMAVGCVEPLQKPDFGDGALRHIQFRVQTDDDALQTKAGPISGADDVVESLFMYCFDVNGLFLGRFQATITTPEQLTNGVYTLDQTPGEFEGDIPPATCRIHFVANADRPVGNDKIGMTEAQIMHSTEINVWSNPLKMAYWGYLRKDNPDALAALFSTEGGTPTTLIYLLRDRLWIDAGTCSDSNVTNITWIIYNGLDKGFIAPFSNSGTEADPYNEDYYDSDFAATTKVTPYPDPEVTVSGNTVASNRFVTKPEDMVSFDSSHPMFAFDDENKLEAGNAHHAVRIIVHVFFPNSAVEYNRTQGLFFPICLTDGDSPDQLILLRGRRCKLDIGELPEVMGKKTFEEAATSTNFANGQLVDIPQEVIEVSDGKYNLKCTYKLTYPLDGEQNESTAIVYQDNSPGQLVVPFELMDVTSTAPQAPGNNVTFEWGESRWVTYSEEQFQNNTVTRAFDPSTGKGTLTFNLKAADGTLREGVYKLRVYYTTSETSGGVTKTKKHVLERNIYIYSINHFVIPTSYGNSQLYLYKMTESDVGYVNGNYRLKFKLPTGNARYPAGLYPMHIKIASRTLQPYAPWINGVKQGQGSGSDFVVDIFGVQVRSTVPNVAPANIPGWGTQGKWDYQIQSKPWNFWYTYSIAKEQVDENGDPVETEVWFDFTDIRNKNGGVGYNTTSSNLGLYLYIEFFGPAISISIDP